MLNSADEPNGSGFYVGTQTLCDVYRLTHISAGHQFQRNTVNTKSRSSLYASVYNVSQQERFLTMSAHPVHNLKVLVFISRMFEALAARKTKAIH